MESTGNYTIQANRAKAHFRTYDQAAIIRKLNLQSDRDYLYTTLLGQPYRVSRTSGDLSKLADGAWVDSNSYEAVMTLLDLLCDSREDRCLTGRWKQMQDFGLMFHRNLLEDAKDPAAEEFDRNPGGLRRACQALGGRELPGCDIGYAIELFDGLEIGLQFWAGDEEFAPRLRYLWDENANRYLRYETMYFAVELLRRRIREFLP